VTAPGPWSRARARTPSKSSTATTSSHRLPQGESGAHRIDQGRHAALIARVEGRDDETGAVLRRRFGAAVDVVDREVVRDVRGGFRWVDRLRDSILPAWIFAPRTSAR